MYCWPRRPCGAGKTAQVSSAALAMWRTDRFSKSTRRKDRCWPGRKSLGSGRRRHIHDRYRHENNEQLDKFVTDEFLVHTVYGCQTVVTNPTSSPQKLDVLTQISVGALPVSGGEATRGLHIQLQPFSTQTIEYYFYFPAAGKYPHYPVHVSKNEQLLASAEPITLNVVDQLSRIDRESWDYISQHGTDEQVLTFLRTANLQRLNLEKIAFRMKEEKFFLTVVDVLTKRHSYNHTLWSYGVLHNAVPAVREFLQHKKAERRVETGVLERQLFHRADLKRGAGISVSAGERDEAFDRIDAGALSDGVQPIGRWAPPPARGGAPRRDGTARSGRAPLAPRDGRPRSGRRAPARRLRGTPEAPRRRPRRAPRSPRQGRRGPTPARPRPPGREAPRTGRTLP